MRTTSTDGTRLPFWGYVALMATTCLAWVGFLQLHPDAEARQLVSNVGLAAIALAAAVQSRRKAGWAAGRVRLAWWLLAGACLSWGCGQLIWTWYENVRHQEVPFPSLADVGYLAFVPLGVAALLVLPIASSHLAGKVRSVLDGLIIATALLFVSWATVLGEVYRAGAGGWWEQAVALAYPLGDVVIITILLLAVVQNRGRHLVPWGTLALLSAGLLAFAVGDSGFAYQMATETYASGDLIDLGWFAGFALVFLAACRPPVLPGPVSRRSEARISLLLPYAAVVAAVVLGAVELALEGALDPFLAWAALALTSLVVLRQVITLVENVSLTRDLEQRVRARTQELHQSERRFRSLVQHSSDVITVVDRDGVVLYQSGSGREVFGRDPAQLVGSTLVELAHPDDRDRVTATLAATAAAPASTTVVEFSIQGGDGVWRHTETTVTNMLDNAEVEGLVLNSRDVTERRSLQRELLHSAFHDPLTQLANRRLFRNRLEQALARDRPWGEPLAVLFLDLDDFKAVNDSYGHGSGDRVLDEVGRRLLQCVRATDTVARLGGDEFAILLEEVSGRSEVNAVARRICAMLRAPFRLEDREVFLAGSVGIAASSEEGADSADDLLRNADLAMYEAKAEGSGTFRWYEPSMHRHVVRRLELDADLRRALERGELYLEYQPIIDLRSGAIAGAEALVRWRHPTRGALLPTEFIPTAEANGLVAPIGEWVLGEACRQLARCQQEAGGGRVSLSVNLSGRQLDGSGIADVVSRAVRASGADPTGLVLEITESVFIARTEQALGNLHALKGLGVRLAVDDFGTGYSALSYLHDLPVDMIKIDKLFIDRLTARPEEAGLAASIVRIGQDLRLVTVAEGVEQRFQLDVLRRIGCDQGQGFLLARPVGAEDLAAMLRCGGRPAPPARS